MEQESEVRKGRESPDMKEEHCMLGHRLTRGLAAFLSLVVFVGIAVWTRSAAADDWPQWRADAARSGVASRALPDKLQLEWTAALPPTRPAWPRSQEDLQFDIAPHAVVSGRTLVLNSSACDTVVALDTRSGEERWRFYADGPVRMSPAVGNGRVYFVSDDGGLYCLDLETGELRWRVAGVPGGERRVLGNERLVSAWPARGGPVLDEGRVYFAASIWPFLGIFIHCVDADTGAILWTNSGDGTNRTIQPHGAPSFATVAPQGHLVVAGDRLLVPGGRSVPAVYDKRTGKLLHFQYDGKRGGHEVFAVGGFYFCGGVTCGLVDGRVCADESPVLGDAREVLFWREGRVVAAKSQTEPTVERKVDRKGREQVRATVHSDVRWERPMETGGRRPLLRTGHQLWVAAPTHVERWDLPTGEGLGPGAEVSGVAGGAAASYAVSGQVVEALAADDRLFAILDSGTLACWSAAEAAGGKATSAAREVRDVVGEVDRESTKEVTKAEWLSELELPPTLAELPEGVADKPSRGFALVVGIESGRLIQELLRRAEWNLVVLESDRKLADRWRRLLQDQGVYGERVAILVASPGTAGLPPYFAEYVVSERSDWSALVDTGMGHSSGDRRESSAGEHGQRDAWEELLRVVRPYGGRLELRCAATVAEELRSAWSDRSEWRTTEARGWLRVERTGPLAGSADWSHQYGDASQAGISPETRVRLPLGLLWFGGPSNDRVLPRHGHGPSPQVAGGRVVLEGPDSLRCLDVYTGRLLWEKELPDLGAFYDNTNHMPGAGEIGSNYVTTADRVYVVHGADLLELDAQDGSTLHTFRVEDGEPGKRPDSPGTNDPCWGYVGVSGDYLLATSSPVGLVDALAANVGSADSPLGKKVGTEVAGSNEPATALDRLLSSTRYASSSRRLHGFDRRSRRRLWTRQAEFNFRHNALAAGNGKVFCLDRFSDAQLRAIQRRGLEVHGQPSLLALDLASGEVLWRTSEDVFGTFLNYSIDHDCLVQGGSVYRDRAYDESDHGIAVYRGADGKRLWQDLNLVYGGPCLLWKDQILTNGLGGFSLRLFDGQRTSWSYRRDYGCNTAIGCENLLTFRSGAAGYCDLGTDSGTGNFGGFRSSCTNNLIPANGVLVAPDYTRTCNCAYQNQTSLAMVHWPEGEYWTFGATQRPGRWGCNWGAPGDRRADSGTLWVDIPDVGGVSPAPPIRWEPAALSVFRLHSSQVTGPEPWICASGVEGLSTLEWDCERDGPHRVRMYFLEPAAAPQQPRRFDVETQGRAWLTNFCPEEAAGGPRIGVMRETLVTPVDGKIRIAFRTRSGPPPVLSGLEILAPEEPAPAGR